MADAPWFRCALAEARVPRSGLKGFKVMAMESQASVTTSQTAARQAPPSAERAVRLAIRDDGICVLTFDRPGSSANIFDLRTLDELAEERDFIGRQTKIKGVIFISAKPAIFIAGADLHAMRQDMPFEEARALIERGQAVMNRVAALPVPTVAAIHGAAVGGGCEICLACDYRIASPDRATKIGLPETQIGLLPAWGGSTRLPRLLGLPGALDIILGGKTVPAKQGFRLGMVDDLSPAEYLVESAVRFIRRGTPQRPGRWLTNNRLGPAMIARPARRQSFGKPRGHYPTVTRALEVATRGSSRSIAASLALERGGM